MHDANPACHSGVVHRRGNGHGGRPSPGVRASGSARRRGAFRERHGQDARRLSGEYPDAGARSRAGGHCPLRRPAAGAQALLPPSRGTARGDTGLLPEGLGELAPFNPGWGLAVQEHVDGRAEWVKWDFPVTTHYQVYERFLAAFWRTTGDRQESVPTWLSGEHFSPWPTWASLGRGGWALYFQAR